MLAVFMAAGLPVVGGVLVMSTLIFLLLFCDDLLSILFPVVLLAMVGTEFYDELLQPAALLVDRSAGRGGAASASAPMPAHRATAAACTAWWPCRSRRCSAVSASSPAREYFSPTALYYSLALAS